MGDCRYAARSQGRLSPPVRRSPLALGACSPWVGGHGRRAGSPKEPSVKPDPGLFRGDEGELDPRAILTPALEAALRGRPLGCLPERTAAASSHGVRRRTNADGRERGGADSRQREQTEPTRRRSFTLGREGEARGTVRIRTGDEGFADSEEFTPREAPTPQKRFQKAQEPVGSALPSSPA